MAHEQKVQQILNAVPALFRCPGGAAAVIKDGEVLAKHAWGTYEASNVHGVAL